MGESVKIGTVIWVEGVKVKFRIKDGVKIDRGQLAKVQHGGCRFILRVVDFRPESLLTQAEVARLSLRGENGEEINIYDKPLRFYDTAIAVTVAQVEDGFKAHGPTSVPPLFSSVYTIGDEDLKMLDLDSGDIELGYVRQGHRVTGQHVRINGLKTFPHHMLICSRTGGGKTNFSKVLALNILSQSQGKYSLIIIDTEGEYFDGGDSIHLGLAHSPYSENRLLYITSSIDQLCRRRYLLTVNGEVVERNILTCPLRIPWSQLHPEDFIQTGFLTPPQEALLWLLWRRRHEDWLYTLIRADSNTIYEELNRQVQKVTINTTKRKIRGMIGDEQIFIPDEKFDMLKHFMGAVKEGYVILIDLPSASELQEKLLTVTVARRVFSAYEGLKKVMPDEWLKLPTILIVVEEAHRYLSKTVLREGGENIFSTISKRGRKYRIGLCCITQMPGELDEPIIRQQLTKIILPLPTKPDYSKVIQYSPYLDGASSEIKTLDEGEAILVSPPSGIKFAVPVKIHSFEELILEQIRGEASKPKLLVKEDGLLST